MFSKSLFLVILLLTGSVANAAYFPSLGVNNFDALGVYNLTPPTLTDGDLSRLQLDADGNLRTTMSGTPALPTGAATSALQTSGNASLTSIDSKLGTIGQKAMAASAPVVIASDQSAIPASQSGTWNITNVSGTVSLPTGAATSALQTTGNSSLSSMDTKTPALGQALAAASVPVVLTAAQVSTLTPPTSINIKDSSGGMISLGQQGAFGSLPVILSNEQTSVPVREGISGSSPGSSTVSTVATLTAPSNAVGFILMNLDTSSANIRYRIGATAAVGSGQQLQPGRDTGYVPCGASVSIIAESGTQNYDIQWVVGQ